MKTTTTALCLLALVLLSGCTRYVWMKPSGDPASFNADTFACKQSAMANAPPVFQVYDRYPSYYEPDRIVTHCKERGNHEICKTRVVGDHRPAPPPQAIDLNESNRSDLYHSCMGAKGWILQAVEDPE